MTSESKIRRATEQAAEELREKRRKTQPDRLTWCIRASLYADYGWRPYY